MLIFCNPISTLFRVYGDNCPYSLHRFKENPQTIILLGFKTICFTLDELAFAIKSFNTGVCEASSKVSKYLVLDRLFLTFTVLPYAEKLMRAISKAPKIYLYDNSDVIDESAKLENIVATHLLKEIQFRQDVYGENYELRFLRDKDKREIDFVILKDRKVYSLIEVKKRDDKISTALKYYKEHLSPKECFQVVFELQRNYTANGITVMRAVDFLASRQLQ